MVRIFLIALSLLALANPQGLVGGVIRGSGGAATASYLNYAATIGGGGATSITINIPAGVVSGDRLIAVISFDIDNTITTVPDGWSLVTSALYTTTLETFVYYKDAGGSEPANYTWGFSADNSIGHIVAFSKTGGTWNDLTDAAHYSGATASLESVTTGSVTTVAGDLLLCGFAKEGAGTVSSAPSGMTVTSLENDTSAGIAQAVYYSSSPETSGAKTKSITWDASDQLSAMAIVVGVR